MQIRPLSPTDDRAAFTSGELRLDDFFRRYAGQNQFKFSVGVTYVAVENDRILGFATVSAGDLGQDELPPAMRKRLPKYPLPVLRLARLATDRRVRGRGIGRALLEYVLRLALRMSEDYGCVGVLVEAKPTAVTFYEKLGFFALAPVEGAQDDPQTMFIALADIKPAV